MIFLDESPAVSILQDAATQIAKQLMPIVLVAFGIAIAITIIKSIFRKKK